MKNITISIDQTTLEAGREYAKAHSTSLNALIRKLLRQNVMREETGNWTAEFFALADRGAGDSRGERWKRENLYER